MGYAMGYATGFAMGPVGVSGMVEADRVWHMVRSVIVVAVAWGWGMEMGNSQTC